MSVIGPVQSHYHHQCSNPVITSLIIFFIAKFRLLYLYHWVTVAKTTVRYGANSMLLGRLIWYNAATAPWSRLRQDWP